MPSEPLHITTATWSRKNERVNTTVRSLEAEAGQDMHEAFKSEVKPLVIPAITRVALCETVASNPDAFAALGVTEC